MAEITFSGLATGMATDDIVTKLMAIERQPLDQLQTQKTNEAQRLQAYGQLNTLLQNLKTAVGAMNLSTTASPTTAVSGNNGVFTATSTSGALGSYNISVSQLAQVQKSVFGGYTSQTDPLFVNGSTLTVNGQTITIDDSNNSLRGIAQTLNAMADQTGVSASIINDGSGSPYRLVLTGKDASTDFTVDGSNLQATDGTVFSMTTTQVAQQAKLNIDGIDVVSNSNTVSGVVAGVTLTLTGVSQNLGTAEAPQYQATSLNVTADTDTLKEKITNFVNAYNAVMNWVSSAYQTDTSTTSDSSSSSTTSDGSTNTDSSNLSTLLRGDATVNAIKRGLQSILGTPMSDGSLKILSEIGISTNRDGSLSIDSSKLDNALSQNFSGVSELLAGNGYTNGVMKQFNSYLLQMTSPSSGMYAQKQTQYNDKVRALDQQISVKTVALDKREADLYARFSAMETFVSNMNSMSSYITQISQLWSQKK